MVPNTVSILGKQFLLGIRHGSQKFILIPADELEHLLVLFTGRHDEALPDLFERCAAGVLFTQFL